MLSAEILPSMQNVKKKNLKTLIVPLFKKNGSKLFPEYNFLNLIALCCG